MAFDDYRTIDRVVRTYQLRHAAGRVVCPAKEAPPFTAHFRAELDLNLRHLRAGRSSEAGSGEILLFPALREVWKCYLYELSMFAHEPLECDADLCGSPDYYVCRLGEYGRIPEPPDLVVVEARRDDFRRAWGPCLAAMLASQKLHGTPDRPVFGITSNGKLWEFGQLLGRQFTQQQEPVAIGDPDQVGQCLHAVFRACVALARTHPAPAAP